MAMIANIKNGKKLCGKCRKFLSFNNFYKSSKYSTGIQSKCKECQKKTTLEYKPKRILWLKKYLKKNGKKIYTYRKQWRRNLRLEVIRKLGNKCKKCKEKDMRVLQIDHINGGGTKDRKMGMIGEGFHKKVLADNGKNYQILCANCNWIKRYENGEYKRK